MKYYAVKNGLTPGIYTSWAECEAQVKGFPGAQFKSFKIKELAEEYMAGTEQSKPAETELPDVYAFCDGSFNASTGVYGYGGFLVIDGAEYELKGSDNDASEASMRNVAGEIHGAMAAIKLAQSKNVSEITLYYDYAGIEQWATDGWKASKPATVRYKWFMRDAMKTMKINFVHVKGHSGIEGNERADKMAKEAVGIK